MIQHTKLIAFAQLPPRHPHNGFSWIYKHTKVIFGFRLKIDLNSVVKILIVYGKAAPFNLKNKQKIHLIGLHSSVLSLFSPYKFMFIPPYRVFLTNLNQELLAL